MSDQEDFAQDLTPSQEHSIAFIVILLFGAMYLFFMRGCQPVTSSISQAFSPAQAVQLTHQSSNSPVSSYQQTSPDLSEGQVDAAVKQSDTLEGSESQLIAADTQVQAAASMDVDDASNAPEPQQASVDAQAHAVAQANDLARIKAEATKLAAITAAQKLEDEKRFAAKQAELEAVKAELAMLTKPNDQTTNAAPAKSNEDAMASSQQNKPFTVNEELARVDFVLPDGRGVKIPPKGFEDDFKQSILQGSEGHPTIVFDRVYFFPGSDLLNPESSDQILGVAGIMNTYKDISIKLRGHTDSTGLSENNLTLSFKRSLNLKKQLVGLGIDSSRIQVEGLGASEPISDNASEKGRNKNRRIDLTILR